MKQCLLRLIYEIENGFFCCSYNPNKATTERHIEALSKSIDLHSSLYDNFIFLGDFNATIKEISVNDFCDFYNFISLINVPTCFKNYNNPTCIALILTNRARSFQNSCTIETGLSDFHKMIVTVMKTTFRKLPPKVIYYRDFRNFDKNYRQAVLAASRNCIGQSSDGNCDHFFSICSEFLTGMLLVKRNLLEEIRHLFGIESCQKK